ncbi:MAG TPA: type I-MYXAN CRISPR-associated protein Cas5/Cmx5/DevS [Pyrinomonadaceae bacterium]|nr:type I-MYXAN CRISPR-associated protein Cas5/Cmx5/DevS [Pyrinomonadaceae bacterium]
MMNTFWLHIHAPFAAFRGFQAGVYRSTSPVMPPSVAYGLVLNLAGIEMRAASNGATTMIRSDVPHLRLAIGLVKVPERNSVYQQLHGYRVGTDAKTKAMAALTKGAKYQIVPVRREVLVNYEGVIGVQTSDEELQAQVARGLRGDLGAQRYGLPFAGDNSYLFDTIELVDEPPAKIVWYTRFQPNETPRKGTCRLTIGIDRADNSKTTSSIYAPVSDLTDAVWTWTPSPPETVAA